jgi:uncharacterized iron-regulated protein
MQFLISLFLVINAYAANSNTVFNTVSSNLYLAGETHIYDDVRSEFTEDLVIFKKSGGVTLALEMIESDKQHLLENYLLEKEESELKLFHYLDVRWGYNTESYMDMIEKARELNLKLLAVDLPKPLWPRETGLMPVPPDTSLIRAAREAHMAKVLCGNYNKTVLLIGSFHTLDHFLPKALREECFKPSYSFKL